jgi:hypothetical protein
VKIKDDEPIDKQYQQQLKKLLFALHKSGKYFYNEYGNYGMAQPLRF